MHAKVTDSAGLHATGTSLWADLWTVPAQASGGQKGKGPSPLLPVWLDFCLQPQRMQAHRGLQQGAAPRLLPDLSHDVASQYRHKYSSNELSTAGGESMPAAWQNAMRRDGGWGMHAGGMMPLDEVLAKSEFLLPQDAATKQMFWGALHPHWDETLL